MKGRREKECSHGEPEARPRAAQALNLLDLVAYADSSIVSRTIAESKAGTVTLFAFAKGQGLSEHSAPYDALVQILDGAAQLRIGGKAVAAHKGELVIMPANVPHALKAAQPFKMLLMMLRAR